MMRKRPRNAHNAPLLEATFRVLLSVNSDLFAGHEACVVLVALMQTSQSLRRVVHQWVTQVLRRDITRGHETLSIPVQASSQNQANRNAPTLSQLLMLLRFQYTTRVLIPVPCEHHRLPALQIQRLMTERSGVKRVLRGYHAQLYAAYDPKQGWGIHAAQRIPCGEYVGEYTGELVSSAEASRRYQTMYDPTRLNYVLSLRERTAHGDLVVRTNVDATRFGCFTRFFNHSCEPTLRMEALRVDSFVPRLVLFTRREVAQGEQLTYDYGSSDTQTKNTRQREIDELMREKKSVRCHCGAALCRGVMPFDGTL